MLKALLEEVMGVYVSPLKEVSILLKVQEDFQGRAGHWCECVTSGLQCAYAACEAAKDKSHVVFS